MATTARKIPRLTIQRGYNVLLIILFAGLGGCRPRVEPLQPLPDGALAGRVGSHTDASKVVFAVIGDAGRGNEAQHAVAAAMHEVCRDRRCDFAVAVGDNMYTFGVNGVDDPDFREQFEEPYAAFGRFDFWLVLGNHDWMGRAQPQIDYTLESPRWRMPHSFYAIPNLPDWLTLFGLDSTAVGQAPELERLQLQAAQDALCGASGWQILFAHHPAHSSGSHGGSEGMRTYIEPLVACGLDVFLAGHDHHQELIRTDDYVQVVQGAGSELRDVSQGGPQQRFAASKLGFSIVAVTPETLKIDFYDTSGQRLHRASLESRPRDMGR